MPGVGPSPAPATPPDATQSSSFYVWVICMLGSFVKLYLKRMPLQIQCTLPLRVEISHNSSEICLLFFYQNIRKTDVVVLYDQVFEAEVSATPLYARGYKKLCDKLDLSRET